MLIDSVVNGSSLSKAKLSLRVRSLCNYMCRNANESSNSRGKTCTQSDKQTAPLYTNYTEQTNDSKYANIRL